MPLRDEVQARVGRYVLSQLVSLHGRQLIGDKALDGLEREGGVIEGDLRQLVDDTVERVSRSVAEVCGVAPRPRAEWARREQGAVAEGRE